MTQIEPTGDQPDPAEAEATSRRERAAAEAKSRDLELTNLMLRAGIDPEDAESPQNALLFKAYDGELTSEAVLAAAKGYGLIKEPVTPTGDITDPDERRMTQDRQQAAGGATPDGQGPSEDPRITAIKNGEEVLASGGTQEAALGMAFDTIAAAGYGSAVDGRKPDPRAQFIPGADDPRRPDQGW